MSPFEITMLLCFGASWPFAIIKTVRTKNPVGKSFVFLVLVIIGYAAGGLHKIFYHYDHVFWLYVFNGLMVAADLVLCAYYRRRQPRM
jgi:hypothetical protein